MKALLLNSGLGSRMGALTKNQPKCMTELTDGETILSRQLRLLSDCGIQEAVITTGAFDEAVAEYCKSLELPLDISFVKNPLYDRTNYIYSIYCARELLRDEDAMFCETAAVAWLWTARRNCLKKISRRWCAAA